jgi:hypothetical protein
VVQKRPGHVLNIEELPINHAYFRTNTVTILARGIRAREINAEHRAKIGMVVSGKKRSTETCANISKVLKGEKKTA